MTSGGNDEGCVGSMILAHQQFVGGVQMHALCRGQVKWCKAHTFTDFVTQVRMEEQGHATYTLEMDRKAR